MIRAVRFLVALVLVGFVFAGAVRAAPVRLRIWEFPRIADPADPQDRYSWLRKLLREFEARNPGVEVELTELTWKAGNEKIRIALFAGTQPDVISGALDPALLEGGHLDPIDAHLTAEDRADYLPGALEGFRRGGRTFGWPWARKGDFLFLDREAFEAAGAPLPEDGRWTREGWEAAVEALRVRRAREPAAPYPLGLALAPGKTAELGLLLSDRAPLLDEAGGLGFRGPAAHAALARLRRWKETGVLPPDASGWNAKDLWVALTRDRSVAMAPFGLWALAGLEKHAPGGRGGAGGGENARFPFELAELPPAAEGEAVRPATSVGFLVLRRADRTAEETALAHALARFITSGENQRVLGLYGQLPTRASTGDLYAEKPAMGRVGRLLARSTALPPHPARDALDEVLKRGVQSFLGEGVPADATLAALSRDAARVLAPPPGGRATPGWVRLLGGLVLLAVAACLFRIGAGLAAAGGGTLLLAGPALLGLVVFMLLPALEGMALAFQKVRPDGSSWVGLENFRRALVDPAFLQGCKNTVLYAAVVVPGNLLAGLVLASLIHPFSKRMRGLFRGAFYLPGVASVVAMALVWRQILDARGGLLNQLLAPGSWSGELARALLPCLERLPAALAVVFTSFVLLTVALRPGGGGREPGKRRERRDALALGVATLALLWVLLGAGGGELGKGGPVPWLTSPDLAFWSVLLMVLVRGPGGMLLVYLAALESVDTSLYEAARADGAGPVMQFYHVTLPALAPTTLFLAVTGIIDSFQAFGQVFLLTDGGPGFSSTVVVHRMYLAAFRDLDFGLAAAQGAMLFAAVAALGGFQVWARSDS